MRFVAPVVEGYEPGPEALELVVQERAVASQVYNVLLRAIGMEPKVKEVEELEERLAELETMLTREKGRTGWG